MELSKNNWLVKLYKFFYVTNYLPTNICSYFWKLLLMWMLLLPVSILYIPCKLHCFFTKSKWYNYKNPCFIGFFAYFILFIIISMILIFFISYTLIFNAGLGG